MKEEVICTFCGDKIKHFFYNPCNVHSIVCKECFQHIDIFCGWKGEDLISSKTRIKNIEKFIEEIRFEEIIDGQKKYFPYIPFEDYICYYL